MMLQWRSRSLWAKKTRNNMDEEWLPLYVHMSDAAEVAKLLWYHWVPSCTKRIISQGVLNSSFDFDDKALSCFSFLAAAHDLGKATPAFQGRFSNSEFDDALYNQINEAGLSLAVKIHPKEARHYWSSQLIMEKYGFSRNLAVILGGHHGQPPNDNQLRELKIAYKKDLGWGKGQESWSEVQEELLEYALSLANVTRQEAQSWKPDITAQVLLSALVIMVDWIVSNENDFPYISLYENAKLSLERAQDSWDMLNLPECWSPNNDWVNDDYYSQRFSFKPRPVQTAILKLLEKVNHPGIIILEAPMGEGKTEAALAAAEALADMTRRSGIFFALPTQASANGLFSRVCKWIKRLGDDVIHSVYLAHGKANLNELYNEIKESTEEEGRIWVGGEGGEDTDDDIIIVHEWLTGRKRGILADFVIGTIDQVLMGSLKHKHLALRHLGLANKVVILDECHAYDAYMSQYMFKILNWLGAYNVPVIVLSATLPGDKRKQMIESYLNRKIVMEQDCCSSTDHDQQECMWLPSWVTTLDYPIITYTDGDNVHQEKVIGERRSIKVSLNVLSSDEEIISVLKRLLSDGGCAGVIVNTVKRAQEIASILRELYGDDCVHLLHSRFIASERARKEKELFDSIGSNAQRRPDRCIVVGTQIFEQSCDLDFDLLITDICPMDLLIQRIGRLHRHNRTRPDKLQNPQCYISGMSDPGFDRGAELIYGKYLLMNTRALLPSQINIPDDIPFLVQEAYRSDGLVMPTELHNEYMEAKKIHEQKIENKKEKASSYQISDPYSRFGNLMGWIDCNIAEDPSGKRGEATVRDIYDSIEVLVVQRSCEGFYKIPWNVKYKDIGIPANEPPEPELARAIAECSIELPRELCWKIDNTIKELEKMSLLELRAWQQSSWLRRELFLILDKDFCAEICGYRLKYDQNGLSSNKIEEGDVNAGKRI